MMQVESLFRSTSKPPEITHICSHGGRMLIAYDTKHIILWQYSSNGMLNDALPCGEDGLAEVTDDSG